MPIAHETVVFDVHDCKVYPLLTDAAGASPTYGPAVDVPGIAEVGIDPNIVTAELKGDARVIAKKGRTDRINFSGTYGKLDIDVLQVILGGAIADGGTGAAETSRYRLKSPASLPYFKIAFSIEDVDEGIGNLQVIIYKAQVTGGTLIGSSTDNFGQPTFDAEGIALNGTLDATDVGVMADWTLFETLTPLSA